jgi:hypothetical protein
MARRLLAAFYIEQIIKKIEKLRHGEIEKRRLRPLSCAGEHAGHDCKEFVGLGFDGIGAGRGNSAFFVQKFQPK